MPRRSHGLIFAILLVAATATAGLDKAAVKATLDDFNTAHRAVRPEFLAFPTYSLQVGGETFACRIPAALRRLGQAGETFRVRKLRAKRDHFEIELETPGKTRVTVRADDHGRLRQTFLDAGFARLLNDIFVYGAPPAPVGFVGHTGSRLLHVDRCNHLPPADLSRAFPDRTTAAAAGYRDCPICFTATEVLPYPNYLAHRASGLQSARTFELVYPPSPDAALQERVDRLAAIVLDGWPLELSGFDYEFRVVRADMPLAVSFPTGIVIVSDMLLQAADADEEVLLVLAHEIAHCELHLPPRSPFAGDTYFDPLAADFRAYRTWSTHQQLAADLVAIAWFASQPAGRYDLARARAALAKVQYATGGADRMDREGDQAWGLHQRLQLFDRGRFIPGDLRRVTSGVDGEDDVRYEARFLGLRYDSDAKSSVPYFLLTTTDYQEKTVHVAATREIKGQVWDAAGKAAEFMVEPYRARPGFTTLVIGQTRFDDYFGKFTPGPLRGVNLWGLDGVKKWRVEEDDGGS